MAGFDADPEDIDAVIRRRDPQFELTADLVDAAPSARAVAAVHRRVRADWRSLWASLGRSAPPPDKPLVTALVQDVRNVVALPAEAADALRRTETRADRARRRLALEAALGDEDLSELRRSTPPVTTSTIARWCSCHRSSRWPSSAASSCGPSSRRCPTT